jgi:hypothetical protein
MMEHHPQLLAGYEMSRSDPRRFLLVCREAPVADQNGAGRWSLDHLFVGRWKQMVLAQAMHLHAGALTKFPLRARPDGLALPTRRASRVFRQVSAGLRVPGCAVRLRCPDRHGEGGAAIRRILSPLRGYPGRLAL